jgi:DNA-binding transcriptional LysR family regulator
MRYTLAELEAFVAIVEAGTFHGAARKLSLTQPTVSQRIRELEASLDVELFRREGQRATLSPAGRSLVDPARRVLWEADELARSVHDRGTLKGVLRLGMTDTFALVCLDDLLRRLESDFPALQASVHVSDSGTAGRMLEEEKLDVAVLVEPRLPSRIRQVRVGANELVWIAGPGVRLPAVSTPRDLADLHIMVPPLPSRGYTTVTEWFKAGGAVPAHVSTCNSPMVVLRAVMSGLVLSLQPTRLVSEAVARGRVRRLRVRPAVPAHGMSLCYQTATLGPGVERVVALARAVIADHGLFAPRR